MSPSGHFAVVGGLRVGASGRGPRAPPASALAIVALRSDSGVRGDSLTARALLDEDGGDPDDPDGVARRSCRATPLLEAHFARSPSLRVLRASWHPAGDAHLVVLLSDGTLRVFDAAAGDGTDASAMEEQAFRLDPWGRGPIVHSPYPLRPEMVDFAFAPPHGWGALSLILLGREGDVYTLCPFAPWGARYPRVTLEALVAPDDVSERWLRATFPTIRGAAARDDDPELEFEDRARFGGRRLGLDFDDEFDEEEEEEEEDPEEAAEESYEESDEEDAYASRRGGGEDESDSGAWRGGTVAARAGGVPAGRARRAPRAASARHGPDRGRRRRLRRRRRARARRRRARARGRAVSRGRRRRRADGGGAPEGPLDVFVRGFVRDWIDAFGRASRRGDAGHHDPSQGTRTRVGAGRAGEDEAALVAAELAGGAPVRPTPLADDDDEGALPPLLAIDRVRLAVDAGPGPGPGPGGFLPPPGPASEPKTADELAPFVTVTWDPACRERVFCAAGAAHAVTLAWLAEVEGAVDDDDDDANDDDDDDGYSARDASGDDSAERASGTRQQQHQNQQQQPALPIPSVVTLMDGAEPLLGMAPVGDPLAEGLVLTVDAGGTRAASTRRRRPRRRRRRDAGAIRGRGLRRVPRGVAGGRGGGERGAEGAGGRPRRRRRRRRVGVFAERRGGASRGNGGGERGVGVCGGGAQGASPSVRAPRARGCAAARREARGGAREAARARLRRSRRGYGRCFGVARFSRGGSSGARGGTRRRARGCGRSRSSSASCRTR